MKILGLDPGTEKSGWVIYETKNHQVIDKGIMENEKLLAYIPFFDFHEMAIEIVVSYGSPIGASTLETCMWVGKFELLVDYYTDKSAIRYSRKEVLQSFGIQKNGKTTTDSMLRTLLIDLFPGGIGKKAFPGPLYGVSKDMFSALALAMNHHVQRDYKGVNKFLKQSFRMSIE